MNEKPESAAQVRRTMLRHVLATIAYRGAKALLGAPEEFAGFRPPEGVRSPHAIVAHVVNDLEFALQALGGERGERCDPTDWQADVARFYDTLHRLDRHLLREDPLGGEVAEKVLQGPLADVLTHVGQLAMLRRLAGSPILGENFLEADIRRGLVGPEQKPPRKPLGS